MGVTSSCGSGKKYKNVRATEIYNKTNIKQKAIDKEIDDWYIRQRGER